MYSLALLTWWLSFLFIYATLFALIILGSRSRARLGTRAFYAGLALLAPFSVLFLGIWHVPDGAPRWLKMTLVFYIPVLMPYLVRTLFVFRGSMRNGLRAFKGRGW
ncbi:hypothetical protein [Thioalkalivibrio sp. ALMg13-2]|uniref:hypothetical protein n=1 Tax=unclassified Thioalkalivibrio TaxID=2621013 RepID=UPI00036F75BC|nr:hypothetical protein [Thioalkalivibrio sp. ALMg13-2]